MEESFFTYANKQYELVRESRAVLFDYCKTISPIDLSKTYPGVFGRGGSIRNLLVHIANTYQFWIGKCGLNRNMDYTSYESHKFTGEIIILFEEVDALVFAFIQENENLPNKLVEFQINGITGSATVFKVFTHVLTHEFHHKGQVLSLSRQMGYFPVDTDIMR